MKIQGVLLGTLREQVEGGDKNPIDPRWVKLDRVGDDRVPVTIGFQQDRVVGRATRVWLEDGRLLFEADVDEMQDFTIDGKGKTLVEVGAIGILVDAVSTLSAELAYDLEMKDITGRTVKGGQLYEVGLTDKNENRNQPPFRVIADATV